MLVQLSLGRPRQRRSGCPDDADGYSDPDPSGSNGPAWTVADGADAFTSDSSQWEDLDLDGYGDNHHLLPQEIHVGPRLLKY